MSATTPSALSPAIEISRDSDSERRARRLRQLAAFLAVLAVGLALAVFVLGSKGDRRFFFDIGVIPLAFVANVVLFPVMGALIVQRRPTTRVAWLMIALGIGIGLGLVTYAYGVVGQPPAPPLPLAMASLVISQIFFVPSIGAAATWILLLYPTDHLIGPRWRAVVVATLYAPLRKRLEAIVDRWFKYESPQFGAYRAEVQKFLQLSEPDLAAGRLAAEAAAELDPVGLAVVDRDGATLATAGLWPQPVAMRLPVGRGDDSIGTLLVGPRRDGQPYDAREVEELAALAILVGTAAIRR